MADRFSELPESDSTSFVDQKNGYRKISLFGSVSGRLRQMIDQFATDKSLYFAQPRSIIVNYGS